MEILDCILGFSLLFPSTGNTLKQWTVLSGTPWRKNLTVVRVQDSNASLIYLSISQGEKTLDRPSGLERPHPRGFAGRGREVDGLLYSPNFGKQKQLDN